MTLFTGTLYGGTNVVVGHPTDTIKTKMQAQAGHFESKSNWIKICKEVYKADGLVGFYRGAFYPFFGSCLYRSTQYAVSDTVFNYFADHEVMAKDIPFTGGC
jgi:solute carrier family 25 carnitine/acylcarnitine transporter 20/29